MKLVCNNEVTIATDLLFCKPTNIVYDFSIAAGTQATLQDLGMYISIGEIKVRDHAQILIKIVSKALLTNRLIRRVKPDKVDVDDEPAGLCELNNTAFSALCKYGVVKTRSSQTEVDGGENDLLDGKIAVKSTVRAIVGGMCVYCVRLILGWGRDAGSTRRPYVSLPIHRSGVIAGRYGPARRQGGCDRCGRTLFWR